MASYTMTDSDDEICLTLESVMDLTTAEDLRLGFLDCLTKGKTIKIMAGNVTRITTPCLQVFLAIKNKTTQLHIDFLIPEMSEAFQNALKDIGLEGQFINSEQKV